MRKKIKNDKYKKARGGRSHLLMISCAKCGNKILEYQKDGPGSLKRIYFDRVNAPEKLVGLQNKNLKDISVLKCSSCKHLLAYPYLYKKEKRKAFRVFQDALIKKIIKLK